MAGIHENKILNYLLFPIGIYTLTVIAASLWIHEVVFKASISLVIIFVLSYEHGFKNYDWRQHKIYFFTVYFLPLVIAFLGVVLGIMKVYWWNYK